MKTIKKHKKLILITIVVVGFILWLPKAPDLPFISEDSKEEIDSDSLIKKLKQDNLLSLMEQRDYIDSLNDSIQDLNRIIYNYKKQITEIKNNQNINVKTKQNEKIYFLPESELNTITKFLSDRYKDSIPN